MKKWFLAFPLLFIVFVFASCLKNDDSKNDDVVYQVIATATSNNSHPSFLSDDGYTLECTNELLTDSATALKVGSRYYLSYILSDTTGHGYKIYPIQLQSVKKIDTKNFVTIQKDSLDNYANSGLNYVHYLGVGGNFLNMIFNTYQSASSSDGYELVRIMKNETNTSQDTLPTVYLELRHNVRSITTSSYNTRLSSINLTPLMAEFPMAKAINLNLHWFIYPNYSSTSFQIRYTPSILSSAAYAPIKMGSLSGIQPSKISGLIIQKGQ